MHTKAYEIRVIPIQTINGKGELLLFLLETESIMGMPFYVISQALNLISVSPF
jgi:hypothetical protein